MEEELRRDTVRRKPRRTSPKSFIQEFVAVDTEARIRDEITMSSSEQGERCLMRHQVLHGGIP
ncbi:hypothetical protein ACGFZP_22330 [Kitasatospora sp. NPDC048239]|uniref:hypothetical protein n=1 Tax=Kitasatospora sp. NPDC048239 TaxID=3364046 RepID=UPI0037238103